MPGPCTSGHGPRVAGFPPGFDSWVEEGLGRCFQLMESDDPALLAAWTAAWSDLVDFEVVRVIGSAEAAERALADDAG